MSAASPGGPIRALLEEDLAELVEEAPAGYVSTYPDGTIVRVNRTFARWLATRPADLLERRFQDLFTVPGRVYYETHLGPLLAMQGSFNEVAVDLARGHASPLPVMVNGIQKRSEAGVPLLNRFTVFNATDRRRYERQLLEAKRQAEAALRAKTELLAMLSHDVRTPLSSILAVAALLDASIPDADRRNAVRILRSAASSVLQLVDDILEHSRIEAGALEVHPRPFDPAALVRELCSNLAPLARNKSIALECSVDPRVPPMLSGDATKLGQILGNLLGNALKFTEHGSVSLETEVLDASADACALRFRVSDTGIGIAEEALAHIFDDYRQANASIPGRYGGSGLGLAISRKLVHALGGELKVQSRAGEGSEFWFDVRLAIDPATPPPAS